MSDTTTTTVNTVFAPTTPTQVEVDRRILRPETIRLGDLPITVVDRAEAARRMVDTALARRGSGLPPQ